jgi:hypothetical protein
MGFHTTTKMVPVRPTAKLRHILRVRADACAFGQQQGSGKKRRHLWLQVSRP